jgi:hypothetical protein
VGHERHGRGFIELLGANAQLEAQTQDATLGIGEATVQNGYCEMPTPICLGLSTYTIASALRSVMTTYSRNGSSAVMCLMSCAVRAVLGVSILSEAMQNESGICVVSWRLATES